MASFLGCARQGVSTWLDANGIFDPVKTELAPHPASPCDAVSRLEVELARPEPALLELRYILAGEVERIRIPPKAPPERADGLWNHTCFEVFLLGDGEPYWEFNFSPSREWAAYRFEAYRCGMIPLATEPPAIEAEARPERFELRASIAIPAGARRLGLSAVIEEADGTRSFWALAHPSGAPDFHDPACFALELPPPPAP